jgi:hypothetical protein
MLVSIESECYTNPEESTMAVNAKATKKPNRSQSIREYLAGHPNAMPKDVVAALKSKGVIVAPGLAGLIKFQMKRGKGGSTKPTRRGPGRPKGSKNKVTRMATAAKTGSRSSNKSDAVREYLAANPTASPATVQQALKARGINISTSLASVIKYSKRGPGRAKGSARARAVATATRRVGRPAGSASNGSLRAEDLLAAKAFVERIGGIEAAKRAIEVLEQLA